MSRLYLFVALVFSTAMQMAAADRLIPAGYYTPIDGKSSGSLKTALHNVIYPHTEISSYSNLPRYFETTDVYPDSKRWWDMYSDIPLYAPSFRGLNREHSFPKSWWGGLTDVPAYIDLNHLYPSEAAANQAKSNYPLGVVDKSKRPKFDNGITTVGSPVSGQGGGCSFVFEPDDEYKGDFARTYFYMVTCYQNMTWKTLYMVMNNDYPTLNTWSRELLQQWNRQDPVSQKEIDRNEAVYGFQNNRNPFIDFPELAEYIWGDKTGEAFILADHMNGYTPGGEPTLINPNRGTTLEFGEVAQGRKTTARLFLHGENLTSGNLRLRIYGDGSEFFTIDGKKTGTAATSSVNSSDGLWVAIDYAPTELGEHNGNILITGGGIQGSVNVMLRGDCLPVPELTAPEATAPTNVSATSYVANWIPVEGETVDYYVVNRTRYADGTATTEQLPAEENYLEIADFSGRESYTVQSVRLGIYSPASNSISVSPTSITGVEADPDFGFSPWTGGVLATCSSTLENVRVYTPSGTLVVQIGSVENNDVIELPAGVYIVTANGVARPVKIIVGND